MFVQSTLISAGTFILRYFRIHIYMATIKSRLFSIGFATSILLLLGLFPNSLVAQTPKKIQRDLEKANEDFQREFYSDARIKFQEILISDPNNLEAIVKLAESNFYLENYNEALGNYSHYIGSEV